MATIKLFLYVFLIISFKCNGEVEVNCPKLCQCEDIEEGNLKVKCENVTDIKEISAEVGTEVKIVSFHRYFLGAE